VSALAAALQLTESQRRELWHLASIPHSADFCPSAPVPTTEVTPTVQAIVDGLVPTPAFVIGSTLDVLAWNSTWQRVAAGLGFFEGARPNLARHAFLRAVPGWEALADDIVSRLRGAQSCSDDAVSVLIEELAVSNEFRRRWAQFPRQASTTVEVGAAHPELGQLRFTSEMLAIGDDDQHLVTWTAADEATAAAFSTRAAPLRLAR
jgi:hypothetical protein